MRPVRTNLGMGRGTLPLIVLAAVIGVAGSGCAGSGGAGGVSKVGADDARQLNSGHASFEQAEDPPIAAATRFAAGQLAEAQGQLPVAVEQYREALRADPEHLPSLFRLGVTLSALAQHRAAVEAMEAYVAKTGEDPAALASLGFCHERAGDGRAAEEAYRRGIARDGRSEPCRVNYGLMLARQGRTAEATIQLQAVLSEAQVQYNLASVWEQQGKAAQARAAYRKALELDPALGDAKARLAGLEP